MNNRQEIEWRRQYVLHLEALINKVRHDPDDPAVIVELTRQEIEYLESRKTDMLKAISDLGG